MIKYKLQCSAGHEFEGWFRDSADYDAQAEQSLIGCPVCGDDNIRKAIMAPAIARSRGVDRGKRLQRMAHDMADAAERARKYVEKNFDYVGDQFPEEARKIHYGEEGERGIYGEATKEEVKDLVDEGVAVAPLPGANKKKDVAGESKPVSADISQTPTKKLN